MNSQVTDGFIRLQNQEELETKLRQDDEFRKVMDELSQEVQAEILKGIDESFQRASDFDVNTPEGEPKVKIGNLHVRLRFTFWEAVKTGASIVIALAKMKVGNPAAVAGLVINMVDELVNRISNLKPHEITVYDAIVDVNQKKSTKTLVIPGASASEIDHWIKNRTILLQMETLKTILNELQTRKVIRVIDGTGQPGGESYYAPVF